MANIKSAKKRIRQNEKIRIRNSRVKSSIRTAAKRVIKEIESKDEKDPERINELFRDYVKKIDTSSRKGIVHWKSAARKKSRLAKRINSLAQQ